MSVDEIMAIIIGTIMLLTMAVVLVIYAVMCISDSLKSKRVKEAQKEHYLGRILNRMYSIENELYRINAKMNYKEKNYENE